MKKREVTHLGIRIEKELVDELKKEITHPYGTVSQLVRNILREWSQKKKKKSV